jgi:hypothetical protein
MASKRAFLRAALMMGSALTLFFALEFLVEWWRLGQPDLAALSWADTNNAKLADILSPVARAYNNILAALLATIGLAIPLTASMHTPKLIEMFLRDRVNQVVLTTIAAGAANVLFVLYLVGPGFAPTWAVRLSVYGALLGWAILIPYFFYVVRFLDPSNILSRLDDFARRALADVRRGRLDPDAAQDVIHARLYQMGTVIVKAIDRADRGVVLEGIWSFKRFIDHYASMKDAMPSRLFEVDRKDFVGLSSEAIELLNEQRTWLEMKVLGQLFVCYRHALGKTVDAVSSISDCTRLIAVHADDRGDREVTELAIRFFNSYLREAIKTHNVAAVYDVFYQYRLLAKELRERSDILRDIVFYFRHYAEGARGAGLLFVWQIAAFDTAFIVRRAFEVESPVRDELLDRVLEFEHAVEGRIDAMVVKAKLVLGAFFLERGLYAEAARVEERLRDVPSSTLRSAERDLLDAERVFFEITDRQIDLQWLAPERRPHVRGFVAQLLGERPSHIAP